MLSEAEPEEKAKWRSTQQRDRINSLSMLGKENHLTVQLLEFRKSTVLYEYVG
jgi:hypothetical protein